jgi:hypothetical protein
MSCSAQTQPPFVNKTFKGHHWKRINKCVLKRKKREEGGYFMTKEGVKFLARVMSVYWRVE